jgi:hypothetical protein
VRPPVVSVEPSVKITYSTLRTPPSRSRRRAVVPAGVAGLEFLGEGMAVSTHRPLWSGIPVAVRADIERLVGGHVVHTQNCAGGFSPGFASRLALDDGRHVFVKAMDAEVWPMEAVTHRTEALVAVALPPAIPAPRLLGTLDDGRWTILAFEAIDGTQPPPRADRSCTSISIRTTSC